MRKLASSTSVDRNRFAVATKMIKTWTVFDSAIALPEICTGETFTCVSMGQCSQMLTTPYLFYEKIRHNPGIHQWGRFG